MCFCSYNNHNFFCYALITVKIKIEHVHRVLFNEQTGLHLDHQQVRKKFNDMIGAKRQAAVRKEEVRVAEQVRRLYNNQPHNSNTDITESDTHSQEVCYHQA